MTTFALNDGSDFDREMRLFKTFINIRPAPKPRISGDAWERFYETTRAQERAIVGTHGQFGRYVGSEQGE